MSSVEQVSQAQAKVENVKAEKDLIKASEQRLSIELDSLRRERHTQTMLMGNLQTIQVFSIHRKLSRFFMESNKHVVYSV